MADFSITGEVRLNSDPAEKSTSKWTVAAGQMIADFAKQASSKLAEVVKSGVDYNATMESYLTNFKVMLGSEEAAATKLSEIRKMAASTPFSLDDLTSGTQTLLQFGIAADDTTGVLQRLGDISLGNAEKLQTLTRAYGKMSSAQKVTLENVNMMIDAGFNPLNQICDATGESMSDLYKRISDGKVSFSELEAAVEAATSQGGQFYNGMLEASQTFSGRMSTLKDNVSALTGELTSGLFAALGELVVKLNEVVVSFLDSDEKMAQLPTRRYGAYLRKMAIDGYIIYTDTFYRYRCFLRQAFAYSSAKSADYRVLFYCYNFASFFGSCNYKFLVQRFDCMDVDYFCIYAVCRKLLCSFKSRSYAETVCNNRKVFSFTKDNTFA